MVRNHDDSDLGLDPEELPYPDSRVPGIEEAADHPFISDQTVWRGPLNRSKPSAPF
jgi:hypothetical protein